MAGGTFRDVYDDVYESQRLGNGRRAEEENTRQPETADADVTDLQNPNSRMAIDGPFEKAPWDETTEVLSSEQELVDEDEFDPQWRERRYPRARKQKLD